MSSWAGGVPYVDFFQHHHPLLWYVLAPALAIAGESAATMVLFRLVFFLLTLAIAWATYRLARECRAPREAAWLGVCLLLSMTTFVYVAIEIRPDVPQVLFGVVSARYFVRMVRTGEPRDAALAGIFAAVAFLSLQKAVLLLAICLVPGVAIARSVFRSNRGQLAKIQLVLDHSVPGDRMYDEWRDFNLFRPDMHYFWFMTKPGVRLYNRYTPGPVASYDVCRLIATAKPRFVSDRTGQLERCGLAGQYRPTPFDRLVALAPE